MQQDARNIFFVADFFKVKLQGYFFTEYFICVILFQFSEKIYILRLHNDKKTYQPFFWTTDGCHC